MFILLYVSCINYINDNWKLMKCVFHLQRKGVSNISFVTEIIWEGFANTDSSDALKKQFDKFCNWCWGHGYGNCDVCKRGCHKLYIPLRIAEKQRELGLEETKRKNEEE